MTDFDKMAAQAEALDNAPIEGNTEPQNQQPIEPDNAAMYAAFSTMTMGLLKAIRARMAKSLPELQNQWTDASLQAVADTVPPVINKYMAKLMPLVGDYPEEGALVMACIPLVMGYIAAQGAAGKGQNEAKQTTSAAASNSDDTTGQS